MKQRLFLIDGHALVFKMYYAFLRRPMINSKGADMSILYGFTKYLLEMIEKERPTHLAVSFDPPGGTFRNQMYPEYKANRDATPQLVIDALEPLTELCESLRIPVLMMMGFEADDVIGSMAKRAEKEGYEVYMVTPDKDYGQLISENIFQYKPGKGGDEREIFGIKEIQEKYGIQRPEQVIDMLAICGDTADNVPGVKGVGEVGASKLIAKYGSLENIYAHLDELTASQRAKFEDAKDHIDLSKQLVTIKTDIEIATPIEAMALDGVVDAKAVELFDHYEFGSLKRHLKNLCIDGALACDLPAAETKPEFSFEESDPAAVCKAAKEAGRCAVSVYEDGRVCVSASGKVATGAAESFAETLSDATIAKYGYEFKPQIKICRGIEGRLMDIVLMDYLINPEKSHKLDMLCKTELGIDLVVEEEKPEQTSFSLFDEIPDEVESPDTGKTRETALLFELGKKKEEELAAHDLTKLFEEMEEPLIRVLAGMEEEGVKVDLSILRQFADTLREEVAEREDRIREMVDEPSLNILSPKQIGVVLYEKLALDPKVKKSKTGAYPTDEETLLDLAERHPVINEILEFRAAKKLLSTYIEPFPEFVNRRTGKIHTTFNQALTATGRLSSSKPNLQNIPIRTERGKEIRKAFVPSRPDGIIMSADYSQIELRIMAHLCQDQHLIASFNAGVDVHKATAAKIFKVDASEVTSDQRRIAKTANFGIMYGISSFGLAQRLKVARSEAKQIIDDYFESFPSIRMFINDTLTAARENGYVETLFGRRRYVPDVNAKNGTVRALAERNAVNAPIQGTSADIIKIAMINVDRRLREADLKSRMVLQIHDELVFDAVPEEAETLKTIITEEMENVIKLSVPLTIECNYGKNWLEAH
ncbi:MAG: DNA polymerase I [Bacteroidales bacterium]|nr:DNA polymerase I [Bacteroidales bacterium]